MPHRSRATCLNTALEYTRELIEERIFNNRYRLDGKLGEGGMATVFSGTDILLRRRVAVKVLREQYAADPSSFAASIRKPSRRRISRIPNIVNTFDVGREGDTYFIVMELVDGTVACRDHCRRRELPEPVALDYAAQIASGLAYAHRVGLLHRDIKPANILITKDDVVKLSDFGIARAVSEHTMTLTKPGLVMGSVYYISPEQAQGHELHDTSRSTVSGIVLYQMLTGTLPFSGDSPVTVALKHIGDPVPVIDVRSSGISWPWPRSSIVCCRRIRSGAFNRQATLLPRCAKPASARALRGSHRRRCAGSHLDCARTATAATFADARSALPFGSGRRTAFGPKGMDCGGTGACVDRRDGTGYFLFARPLPSLGTGVVVEDYTGMTQAAAQQAVVNAGLRTRFTKRKRDGSARSRDPSIAAGGNEGGEEPSRRAGSSATESRCWGSTTCAGTARTMPREPCSRTALR